MLNLKLYVVLLLEHDCYDSELTFYQNFFNLSKDTYAGVHLKKNLPLAASFLYFHFP